MPTPFPSTIYSLPLLRHGPRRLDWPCHCHCLFRGFHHALFGYSLLFPFKGQAGFIAQSRGFQSLTPPCRPAQWERRLVFAFFAFLFLHMPPPTAPMPPCHYCRHFLSRFHARLHSHARLIQHQPFLTSLRSRVAEFSPPEAPTSLLFFWVFFMVDISHYFHH